MEERGRERRWLWTAFRRKTQVTEERLVLFIQETVEKGGNARIHYTTTFQKLQTPPPPPQPLCLSVSLPNSSKSSLPSLNWELERIIVSRNINERNKQHATSDECESLVLKEEWKHVRIEFDTSEGHHGILNFPLSL